MFNHEHADATTVELRNEAVTVGRVGRDCAEYSAFGGFNRAGVKQKVLYGALGRSITPAAERVEYFLNVIGGHSNGMCADRSAARRYSSALEIVSLVKYVSANFSYM